LFLAICISENLILFHSRNHGFAACIFSTLLFP
jgi:hypothetical protein